MKMCLIFLIVLIALALTACGDQPNRYQVKVWVVVGTIYQIRDDQLHVVQERFCWATDEPCNTNPWGFPVPKE